MKTFSETELMLNPDGSIFHLHLLPDELAENIILVGDPARVNLITQFLTSVDVSKSNREFYSTRGFYNKKQILVVSTGIGTDNIDIVINELDALANIDFKSKMEKSEKRQLRFFRLGTCGLIQPDIPVSSFIVSDYCIGFDNLMSFYECRFDNDELVLKHQVENHFKLNNLKIPFYLFKSTETLKELFQNDFFHGITVATPGFYGPQDRFLRLKPENHDLLRVLSSFKYNNQKIINFEMETSAIYGLSSLLGHQAITIDLALGNRIRAVANLNYKEKLMEMCGKVLDIISA